jgi:hypothetical protein
VRKRRSSASDFVKARSWIDDLASGRIQSFAEIAQREGKVERHVRLLAPLAFTPPEMLSAIIAGSAPEDLTVTALAQSVPCAWRRASPITTATLMTQPMAKPITI